MFGRKKTRAASLLQQLYAELQGLLPSIAWSEFESLAGYGASENLLPVLMQALINQQQILAALGPQPASRLAIIEEQNMPIQLPESGPDAAITLYVQSLDAKEQPTSDPLPMTMTWCVDDPSVATVQAAADGLSAVLTAVGTVPATCNVSVTDGVLTASDVVALVAGPPASLNIGATPPPSA